MPWAIRREWGVVIFLVGVCILSPGCGSGAGNNNGGSGANPVPVIASLTPDSGLAGQPSNVVIAGSGFTAGSLVSLNGTVLPATFISNQQLQVSLSAQDLTAGGVFPISVSNPAPGGGLSNSEAFVVCTPLVQGLTFSSSVNGLLVDSLGTILLDPSLGELFWYDYDSSQGFSGGSIKAVSISTPASSLRTVAGNLGDVSWLIQRNGNLYWGEVDHSTVGPDAYFIKQVFKAGGTTYTLARTENPTGSAVVENFISVPSSLYWGDSGGPNSSLCVSGLPEDGLCIKSTEADLAAPPGPTEDVFKNVDFPGLSPFGYYAGPVTELLYATGPGPCDPVTGVCQGSIFSLDLSFCCDQPASPTTITSNFATNAASLFVDAKDLQIYGVDQMCPKGTIFKIPLFGGTPTYLATNVCGPSWTAIDDNFAYYFADGASNPSRVSKAGGTPAAEPNCGGIQATLTPLSGTVDATSLYLTLGRDKAGQGMVVQIPK